MPILVFIELRSSLKCLFKIWLFEHGLWEVYNEDCLSISKVIQFQNIRFHSYRYQTIEQGNSQAILTTERTLSETRAMTCRGMIKGDRTAEQGNNQSETNRYRFRPRLGKPSGEHKHPQKSQ